METNTPEVTNEPARLIHAVDQEFLEAIVQIIDIMSTRGAILGPELVQVGMIRQYALDKLNKS